MFRLPLLRLKPWKKLQQNNKNLETELDIKEFDAIPTVLKTCFNAILLPGLYFMLKSANLEYLMKEYYENNRRLGLWVAISNTIAFGMVAGVRLLNYTPGLQNFVIYFSLPIGLAGVYGILNESWKALCGYAIGNSLLIAHVGYLAKSGRVPVWLMPGLLNFFMMNSTMMLYSIYSSFAKESYLFKTHQIYQQIIEKKYVQSNDLKE